MSKERPCIFVVDDDEPFRRSLSRLMNAAGFDVEASDAQDFLARETYPGPSCLLLDLRMPGITGLDVQKELLRRNVLIPIVFLTAHRDTRTAVEAMKHGAVDFLLKPVDEADLFRAIDRALEQDARTRETGTG